jgi:hypothetical protein
MEHVTEAPRLQGGVQHTIKVLSELYFKVLISDGPGTPHPSSNPSWLPNFKEIKIAGST